MGETNISGAEWRVMEVIWQRPTATAAEVIAALASATDWKHRTIRTLLARLVEKGVLAAQPDGNRHLYRPLIHAATNVCGRKASRSCAGFFEATLASCWCISFETPTFPRRRSKN